MSDALDVKIYSGSVAPTATVTTDATGATITIVDSEGTHSAHINNGSKGDTGAAGEQGPRGYSITSITENTNKQLVIQYGDGQTFTTSPVEAKSAPYINNIIYDDNLGQITFYFNEALPDGRTYIAVPFTVLPTVTAADNGRVLKVVQGHWAKA